MGLCQLFSWVFLTFLSDKSPPFVSHLENFRGEVFQNLSEVLGGREQRESQQEAVADLRKGEPLARLIPAVS